jgi:capsular exopolysaccharide synthesis family protein
MADTLVQAQETSAYPQPLPGGPPGAAPPPPQAPARRASEPEGFDVRQYIAIVLGRWWLILLALLIGAGIGAVRCHLSIPLYRAGCRLEVVQDPRLTFEQGRAGYVMDQELSRRTIILQSGLLRGQVRDALYDEWKDVLPGGKMSPKISIRPVRGASTMLDITVDTVDGKYALAYLKELLEKYQTLRRTEMTTANEAAMRSLKTELENVTKQLQDAQDELAEFLSKHSMQISEAKAKYDEAFLASLIQRQNALRMERTMLESQFSVLDKLSTGAIQDVLTLNIETHRATLGPLSEGRGEGGNIAAAAAPVVREQGGWQSEELQLARLQAQYEEDLALLKPDHPRMLELKRRIEDVQRDLKLSAELAVRRLRDRHQAVSIQDEALENAIRTWRAELNLTVSERANYQALTSKVEHLQKIHDVVYSRVLDGTVMDLDAVYSRLVEQPSIHGQIWPNKSRIMTMHLIIAFGIGVALAFLFHHFDTTLLDIQAVEERFGVPYVSGIPHWDRVLKTFNERQNQVIVSRDKTNVATEVYRTVRGTLEHMMGNSPSSYALVITSSDAGDGKSLTALNLAVVFAWTGRKVLLVDGDLRRGAIHKGLGLSDREGYTELLTGNVSDWHTTVQKTEYDNLSFISSGKYVQEAPEQLGSARMQQLLSEWKQEYDLIVFDSAPVSRVMDTAVLARSCDGVLVVARFAKTKLAEFNHLLRRLEGTPVIGFCVNCIDFHKLSKGYGYRGYYGYGSYYGYDTYYGYGYYAYRPYGEKRRAGRGKTAAKEEETGGKT